MSRPGSTFRANNCAREPIAQLLQTKSAPHEDRFPPRDDRTSRGAPSPIPATSTTSGHCSAHGRIRTCDARFRKPTLYPLSYAGGSGLESGDTSDVVQDPRDARYLSPPIERERVIACLRPSRLEARRTHCTTFPRRGSCRHAPGPRPSGLCRPCSRRAGVATSERIITRRASRAHASPSVPRTGSDPRSAAPTYGQTIGSSIRRNRCRQARSRVAGPRVTGLAAAPVYRSSTTVDTLVTRTPSTTDPEASVP